MALEQCAEIGDFYDSATDETGVKVDTQRVHVTGKITTDTPLLTTAQNVADAINELFTLDPGGGNDNWQIPGALGLPNEINATAAGETIVIPSSYTGGISGKGVFRFFEFELTSGFYIYCEDVYYYDNGAVQLDGNYYVHFYIDGTEKYETTSTRQQYSRGAIHFDLYDNSGNKIEKFCNTGGQIYGGTWLYSRRIQSPWDEHTFIRHIYLNTNGIITQTEKVSFKDGVYELGNMLSGGGFNSTLQKAIVNKMTKLYKSRPF